MSTGQAPPPPGASWLNSLFGQCCKGPPTEGELNFDDLDKKEKKAKKKEAKEAKKQAAGAGSADASASGSADAGAASSAGAGASASGDIPEQRSSGPVRESRSRNIDPNAARYKIDNSVLQTKSHPGIDFRNSKLRTDKVKKGMGPVRWGEIIEGVEEGDGWLKVGNFYLPMKHEGLPVITKVEEAKQPAPKAKAGTEGKAEESIARAPATPLAIPTAKDSAASPGPPSAAQERPAAAKAVEMPREGKQQGAAREKPSDGVIGDPSKGKGEDSKPAGVVNIEAEAAENSCKVESPPASPQSAGWTATFDDQIADSKPAGVGNLESEAAAKAVAAEDSKPAGVVNLESEAAAKSSKAAEHTPEPATEQHGHVSDAGQPYARLYGGWRGHLYGQRSVRLDGPSVAAGGSEAAEHTPEPAMEQHGHVSDAGQPYARLYGGWRGHLYGQRSVRIDGPSVAASPESDFKPSACATVDADTGEKSQCAKLAEFEDKQEDFALADDSKDKQEDFALADDSKDKQDKQEDFELPLGSASGLGLGWALLQDKQEDFALADDCKEEELPREESRCSDEASQASRKRRGGGHYARSSARKGEDEEPRS